MDMYVFYEFWVLYNYIGVVLLIFKVIYEGCRYFSYDKLDMLRKLICRIVLKFSFVFFLSLFNLIGRRLEGY